MNDVEGETRALIEAAREQVERARALNDATARQIMLARVVLALNVVVLAICAGVVLTR